MVPYAVLVGMVKRVPCQYIFEQSTQLLTLPPLPIAFDRGPFERYRHIIERIERARLMISLAEWDREVRHDDLAVLAPLIEQDNSEITLSAVGLLLLDEVRSPAALVPFLSRAAWNDCLDNLSRLKDCHPFRFLNRVAADQNQFRLAEHINAGNGLRWLKPGRTTDRYLVSIEDWRMLVWRAIREDEIWPDYPRRIAVNAVTSTGRSWGRSPGWNLISLQTIRVDVGRAPATMRETAHAVPPPLPACTLRLTSSGRLLPWLGPALRGLVARRFKETVCRFSLDEQQTTLAALQRLPPTWPAVPAMAGRSGGRAAWPQPRCSPARRTAPDPSSTHRSSRCRNWLNRGWPCRFEQRSLGLTQQPTPHGSGTRSSRQAVRAGWATIASASMSRAPGPDRWRFLDLHAHDPAALSGTRCRWSEWN